MSGKNSYSVTWNDGSVSHIISDPPIIADCVVYFHGDDIKNNVVDDRKWIIPLSSIKLIAQQNIYTDDEIFSQIEAK